MIIKIFRLVLLFIVVGCNAEDTRFSQKGFGGLILGEEQKIVLNLAKTTKRLQGYGEEPFEYFKVSYLSFNFQIQFENGKLFSIRTSDEKVETLHGNAVGKSYLLIEPLCTNKELIYGLEEGGTFSLICDGLTYVFNVENFTDIELESGVLSTERKKVVKVKEIFVIDL